MTAKASKNQPSQSLSRRVQRQEGFKNSVNKILVVLQRSIPSKMKLPLEAPLAYSSLTKEQFDLEMEKGIEDIQEGSVYSADTFKMS